MSRGQIQQLIAGVQSRTTPPEQLPAPTIESTAAPIWTRIPVPDWLSPESRDAPLGTLRIEPGDEITIEAEDLSPSGLGIPDSGFSEQFEGQAPSFDVLAYYLPFHFYRDRWGIYLLESGIWEVARHIVQGNHIPWRDRWIIGFAARALFLHEFFHHAVEVACSRLELPLPTTWLGEAHYNSYFVDSVAAADEESLANAHVARNIRRYYPRIPPQSLRNAYWNLRTLMDRQPGPYNEYSRFVSDEDYSVGRDGLISAMYDPWLRRPPALESVPATPISLQACVGMARALWNANRPANYAGQVRPAELRLAIQFLDAIAESKPSAGPRGSAPALWSLSPPSLLTQQAPPGSILPASMYFAGVTPSGSEYPVHIVLDLGGSHLRIAKPFRKDLGLEVSVHSNDHIPPHIHVRDLDGAGDFETRYLWPSLAPYCGDPRLPRRKEKKSLPEYVDRYKKGLAERIAAVYGAI